MSKKVLIIDDACSMRNLVKFALGKSGFEVLEAGDGEEGLSVLAKHTIDLILCDVNMPIMNGWTMLEKIKENPKTSSIPVYMLTTEAGGEMVQKAKDLGVKGWIVKPFEADKLLAAVQKLI